MSRTRVNLNREWQFFRGDAPPDAAAAVEFDDSSWQPIGLPHTFDLPYFRTPEFYVGYGWYRKSIDVPPSDRPRRYFLEFDGVFQVAEVFVNGRPVGQHRGGYTGFSIDVTDAIRPGSRNLIAVRANNNWDPQLQPRAGEHVFCGGIYRDVHLVATDAVHIAWNGISIKTPRVSRESASVQVTTEVCNDADAESLFELTLEVSNPLDEVVAVARASANVARRSRVQIEQMIEAISSPALWHPDEPHLYTARVFVRRDGRVVDNDWSQFGFRWFEWTADRGFFLNGEHLYLRGANAHQDHAGWGIGVTAAACERDVRLMKEAGFNFVRGAHYPHHPAFADACDRLGLLFWSENAFWGKGGFGPEGYWNSSAYPINDKDFAPFEQSCRDQLAEMIRINRNHPSIITWSMTNEAFFTYNLDRAKSLMADLVRLSRELDPTRPAAIGGAQRGDVDKLGDGAGYNGDGARLFLDPGVPSMVSEYGAISKPHDAYDPFFGELQTERYPWRAGQAIWAGFDYGSIAGRQGLKGIVNHQRVPKRSWHWYRNAYLGIAPPPVPVEGTPAQLTLDADKATIIGADATDDVQLIVTVRDAAGRHLSNSPPVTLTIESGPGEFPTGRSITFDAATDFGIEQGQAAIAFRSYHGGRSVIRATSPGLADATIEIETHGEPAFIPGLTPLVPDRPYVPPPESETARRAMSNAVNVALNRPSRATSERERHPARLANDGDPVSAWFATDNDASPHWTLDLEGFYQLASLRLTFASEGNHRFLVELSTDRQTWTTGVDRRATENTRAIRNDVFPPGVVARYLRVNFVSNNPNLAEVELFGILSVR